VVSLPNHVMYQIHFETAQFRDRSNGNNVDIYNKVLVNSDTLRSFFYDELKPMAKYDNKKDSKYIKNLISFGYSDILFDILDEDTPSINFRNSRIPLLPKLDRFKSVYSLCIGDCGLREIPKGISKLDKMEILSLPNNKISMLPNDIGFCKKLTFINLVGNPIKEIPNEISKLDTSNGGSLVRLTVRIKDIGEENFNKLKELLPTTDVCGELL
jgi:Leucine-rich repeat (LRR) protein